MTIPIQSKAALMRLSKTELADQVMTLTRRVEELETLAEQKGNRLEQQLYQAVEMLPHPVIIYDLDDHLVFSNQAYHNFFPYMPPLEEVAGKHFLDFIQHSIDMPGVIVDPLLQEDLQAYQAKRLDRLHNPPQGSFEQFSSGEWHLVSEHRIEGLGFFSIRQNITDRVMVEQALATAENQLRDAIESVSEGFALFDPDGRLVIANGRYKEFYNYSDEDASPGVHMEELGRLDLERETVVLEDQAGEYLERRDSDHQLRDTFIIHLKNGRILETRDRKTTSGGIVSVQEDITERQQTEQQLLLQATIDQVTGLPNRALLFDRLDRAMEHARREKRSIGLIFVDLDHFKQVNDLRGHAAGDQMLKMAGQRLSQLIRHEDTVARLGGDEFVVLLNDVEMPNGPEIVAKKIVEVFVNPFNLDGHDTFTTASLGISIYPDDGEDAETLLQNADAAMYNSKRNGRNTFRFFTPGLNDQT